MDKNHEIIVLGGGCFWCIEAIFRRIPGVQSTIPGYAGGHLIDPGYEQVCSGTSGHAEVVEIVYNPGISPLTALLEVFWKAHDPTTLNRQGNDIGNWYRSVIFYTDESQKVTADKSIAEMDKSGAFPDPLVTRILPLETFWPAEDYHRYYYDNNRNQGYCRAVIDPKLEKLALSNCIIESG